MDNDKEWKHATADVFWGEIAPCDHLLQIYENDTLFIAALTGFVIGGFQSGEACIVIATDPHLKALELRLGNAGIDIIPLLSENRYIPLTAKKVLAQFMVNGWPEESLFFRTVAEVLFRAKGPNDRRIRAFGEMVALLWAEGHNGATVQLEELWNLLSHKEKFSLFCAYPRIGFTEDITDSIRNICCAHSKMIEGSKEQTTEVFYQDTGPAVHF